MAEASSPSLFSANEVVFHESVHYLVRNASSFRYPTWFDEGFAQVPGTAYLDDGAIVVGYPPKTAAYVMQYEKLMPVERLADTASTYDLGTLAVGRFYATSWLLVHYLLLSDDPRLQQQAHQYLMANNAGRADFEATFGSFDAVDAALEKYGRGLPFGRIPMERISLQPEFHPQRLEPREIAYELASLTVMSSPSYARSLFSSILESDPAGRCMDSRALDEARGLYQRAHALDPGSPETLTNYAARRYLQRAAGWAVDFPEEHARIGRMLAQVDADGDALPAPEDPVGAD